MSTTYYTADLHFGHEKIIELAGRPFADVDEMNHTLITVWNQTVRKADDIVYVLGDLSIESQWRVGLECARQLNGRKRFIEGNHDQCWSGRSGSLRYRREYAEVFELVAPWAREKVDGIKVLLSHFPYEGDHTREERFDAYRLRDTGIPLLHGHIHGQLRTMRTTKGTLQMHVGCEAWGYRPLSAAFVAETLRSVGVDRPWRPREYVSGLGVGTGARRA